MNMLPLLEVRSGSAEGVSIVVFGLFMGETFGAALVNRAPAVELPCLGPSGFDPLAFGQQAGLRTLFASAPWRCAITCR